jgi:hypothetical protein
MIPARAPQCKPLASAARLRYLERVARIWATVLLATLLGCGEPRPQVSLEDLDGARVSVLPVVGAGASVFIVVSPDCPISNRYASEIARLRERFARDGMSFRIVYPGTRSSLAALRRHRADFFKDCPALQDPEYRLTRAAGIERTPEAAVFTSSQGLVYHGRIDDWFADVHLRRPSPTRRDLEAALAALARGDAAPPAAGPSVGCPLP